MGQESRHSLVVSCASGSLTRLQSVGSQLGLTWGRVCFQAQVAVGRIQFLQGMSDGGLSFCHPQRNLSVRSNSQALPTCKGRGLHEALIGCHPRLYLRGFSDCCSSHMQNAPASQVLQGSHPIIASIWAPESQHLHQSQVWLRCLGCSSWSPAPGTQFFSVCELSRLMTQVISPHTQHKKVGLQSMATRATPSQNRRKCGGKGVQWSHCPSSNAHVWVCSKCPELNSNVILFCAFALSWSFLYKYVVSFLLLLF